MSNISHATTMLVCTKYLYIGIHFSCEDLFFFWKQKDKCQEISSISVLPGMQPNCKTFLSFIFVTPFLFYILIANRKHAFVLQL